MFIILVDKLFNFLYIGCIYKYKLNLEFIIILLLLVGEMDYDEFSTTESWNTEYVSTLLQLYAIYKQ